MCGYVPRYTHYIHLSQPSQHAELTEDFKQYLESKGLSEASLFTILHWVLIALFCKLIPVISELISLLHPHLIVFLIQWLLQLCVL